MPRVVSEQRHKFDNDDLFRKMSRETEIKYTGYRDRSHEERIVRFQTEARDGQSTIAFVSSGTNFSLLFPKGEDGTVLKEFLDFDREPGKVFIKSRFIMNGVCVVWRGWIDLQRLDGVGYLEFDEDKAKNEDKVMRDTVEKAKQRMAEFEDRQRQWRDDHQKSEASSHQHINFRQN